MLVQVRTYIHTYVHTVCAMHTCVCRCRKLPKGLKEWQAFNDLKQKIDDFNECCPLLELMANRSMKERHWDRIATITQHTFEVESETFSLRNIMEAPLLEHKEDIEDICISAVKEKDIEAKLKQVIADWSVQNLSFSSFKTRGELLLKGAETAEIISLMEDSLMILSSLMSNRLVWSHGVPPVVMVHAVTSGSYCTYRPMCVTYIRTTLSCTEGHIPTYASVCYIRTFLVCTPVMFL